MSVERDLITVPPKGVAANPTQRGQVNELRHHIKRMAYFVCPGSNAEVNGWMRKIKKGIAGRYTFDLTFTTGSVDSIQLLDKESTDIILVGWDHYFTDVLQADFYDRLVKNFTMHYGYHPREHINTINCPSPEQLRLGVHLQMKGKKNNKDHTFRTREDVYPILKLADSKFETYLFTPMHWFNNVAARSKVNVAQAELQFEEIYRDDTITEGTGVAHLQFAPFDPESELAVIVAERLIERTTTGSERRNWRKAIERPPETDEETLDFDKLFG